MVKLWEFMEIPWENPKKFAVFVISMLLSYIDRVKQKFEHATSKVQKDTVRAWECQGSAGLAWVKTVYL